MNHIGFYPKLTAVAPIATIPMMKLISESRAIETLSVIREEFRQEIEEHYEHRAKPCSSCETPGACCLDAHFVNVRISRLEAIAIRRELDSLPEVLKEAVRTRIGETIERCDSQRSDSPTYACPLFEKGIGCIVHATAKPLPCIAHACYSRKEDLPPDELLTEREIEIDQLNRRVYGRSEPLLPIPIALGSAL